MQIQEDHLVGRLPDYVIHAIQHGRKIEAIKHIRGHYNVGLKEAKHIVDEYISENGEPESEEPKTIGITTERIVFLLIIATILYGLYDYLMK